MVPAMKSHKTNSLETPTIKNHKTNSLEIPTMESTKTAVNSEKTADWNKKRLLVRWICVQKCQNCSFCDKSIKLGTVIVHGKSINF